MKAIVQLISLAALPMCGSLALEAQEAPSPPTVPPTPAVVPAPKAPRPVREQQFTTTLRTRPGAGTGQVAPSGGGGGMGGYGSVRAAAFSDRLQRIVGRVGGAAPAPNPLIIRSSTMTSKNQAGLEEDLAIMAHILDKAANEAVGGAPSTAMGIDVFGGQSPAAGRTLFLEGYGALFTLNVGFPLIATKSRPEQQKEEAPANSTWEQAKRELYGRSPEPMMPGVPFEEFNAGKVDKLTDALVDALRNAGHIRGMKGDEVVTVCLLGAAAVADDRGRAPVPGTPPSWAALGVPPGTAGYTGAGPQKTTVLTIQIKRADADALAKGELKPEEFRKRARIERYEDGLAARPPLGIGGGAFGGTGGFGGGGRF